MFFIESNNDEAVRVTVGKYISRVPILYTRKKSDAYLVENDSLNINKKEKLCRRTMLTSFYLTLIKSIL